MDTRLPRKTTYQNINNNTKISSENYPNVTGQDLANQGYVPVGTEEKVDGGTLFAGSRDPQTGKRFERFVQDKKAVDGNTGDGGTGASTSSAGDQNGSQGSNQGGNQGGDQGRSETGDGKTSGLSLTEPDRDKIRTEKLQDAQSVIDAINESYNRILAREREIGQDRAGRTRALNISGNLAGSDFATASAIDTERINERIQRSYEAERDAKIQSILTDVKNETEDTYEKRRQEYLKEFEDKTEAEKQFLKGERDTAIARIELMAGKGVDAEEFQKSNPDVYAKLKKNSGLTDIELASIWNAKSSDPIKYEYKELKDGTLLRTGSDGTVKEMGNYAPPDDNPAWKIESLQDGSLYWTQKNEKGEIIDFKKFDSDKPKPKNVSQSVADKAKFEQDKREMVKALSSVSGEDNFVSPDDYNKAKKAWIDEGYSPTDFDTEYQGFRNPNNPNYQVGGAKKETEVSKAEADAKKEAEKNQTLNDALQRMKDQNFSRKDIEKSAEAKYGYIPDAVETWLDENY